MKALCGVLEVGALLEVVGGAQSVQSGQEISVLGKLSAGSPGKELRGDRPVQGGCGSVRG